MMSVSYYCEDTKKKNRLSRVNVEVDLAGIKVNMNMLIVSGSTSSFINPKLLPPGIAMWIENFIDGHKNNNALKLTKTKLIIKAALSESTMECAIATPRIKIGDWIGEHEFIFAEIKGTAIIGHDFLPKFNADFNFTNGKLRVDDNGMIYH